MLNRCVLIGRVATDPELNYTPLGVAVTKFRIALDRPYLNGEGGRDADFPDLVAWRADAENISKYATKGRLMSVEGRLQTRSYTAQDGSRRRVTEVVVENWRLLDKSPAATARDEALLAETEALLEEAVPT